MSDSNLLSKAQSLHYTGHRTYEGRESTLHQIQKLSRHWVYITPDMECI